MIQAENLSHQKEVIYPVRNNAPLLCPVHHAVPQTVLVQDGAGFCSPAIAGLDFRIISSGFNAPLEFLTGFTPIIRTER
jgi:hypothetical protein